MSFMINCALWIKNCLYGVEKMVHKKILYTSADVRKNVVSVLSSRKKRVVITAFVGEGVESYLPKPQGITLICWPKPGGTNPHSLRWLQRNGANVLFCDSLHMKLYWSEDKGAVMSSANLTTNALGAGNLKEIGIYLNSQDIDIDRIQKSLKIRKMTSTELANLERQHDNFYKNNHVAFRKDSSRSFTEWLSDEPVYRPKWKLGWWDSETGYFCEAALNKTKKLYQIKEPTDYIPGEKKDFSENDWILCFRMAESGKCSNFRWLFVDFVVKSVPREKAYERDYPYQAVQVWSKGVYNSPPFEIDKKFRACFQKVVKQYGVDKFKNLIKPSSKFIRMIEEYYELL